MLAPRCLVPEPTFAGLADSAAALIRPAVPRTALRSNTGIKHVILVQPRLVCWQGVLGGRGDEGRVAVPWSMVLTALSSTTGTSFAQVLPASPPPGLPRTASSPAPHRQQSYGHQSQQPSSWGVSAASLALAKGVACNPPPPRPPPLLAGSGSRSVARCSRGRSCRSEPASLPASPRLLSPCLACSHT